jgi:uncharacterized protein (TIGR00730 family)
MRKTVTVFGSSLPRPGDAGYESAFRLGKILAQNNLNVCTGGFQGIMDAVSKGAAAEGAEAIGITVKIFNAHPSEYLTKEIKCDTLFERLSKLLEIGDAYIILNGGTGTLLELALVWELMNKNLLTEKPCVSVGQMWDTIITAMEQQIVKEKRRTSLIKCFDTVEECSDYIIKSL